MNYKPLLVLFYGILMGTANKIPGVSGGLVAIAIGFYEKLVFSLKKFDKTAFKKIINFRFKDFFQYVNGSFLSLIFLGIIISYFSTSKILEIFLDKYEIYVWSLFFGLVIGTIFHLKKLVNFKSNINLLFAFAGISFRELRELFKTGKNKLLKSIICIYFGLIYWLNYFIKYFGLFIKKIQ